MTNRAFALMMALMPRPWFFVALVLIGVASGIGVLYSSGRPDDCATGDSLFDARLLDEAAAAYQRSDEPCARAARIRPERLIAAAAFARAEAADIERDVQTKAKEAAGARAKKAGKKGTKATTGKAAAVLNAAAAAARARDANTTAVRARVAGLRHEFDADELTSLTGAVKKLPDADRCDLATEMADGGLLAAAASTLAFEGIASCDTGVSKLQEARERGREEEASADLAASEGNDAEARVRYASAFAADSSREHAKSELTRLAGDRDSDLAAVGDALEDTLDWLGDNWNAILVALLAATLVGLVLFRLLRWAAYWSRRLRNWLAPSGSPSAGGRRIARLQVKFEKFDGGNGFKGDDATVLIGDALGEPGTGSFPFDRLPATQSGTAPIEAIANVLAATPQGNLLGPLVKALGPLLEPRTATVSGRLVPSDPAGTGAGIALSLAGPRGELAASEVLRERLIDPAPGDAADGWARLVPAAGAWLRHHLRPLAGVGESAEGSDWRGEALVEAGRQWANKQDWARASTCFARAYEENRKLLPALVNLAVVDLRRGDYDSALTRLEKVLEKASDATA